MNETFEIHWSKRAIRDLRQIEAYLIEHASEQTAGKVIRGLFDAVEPAAAQPERFPPERRLVKRGNFRFALKWRYRIIYEFTGIQIIVHRVVHSRRDMKKSLRNVR